MSIKVPNTPREKSFYCPFPDCFYSSMDKYSLKRHLCSVRQGGDEFHDPDDPFWSHETVANILNKHQKFPHKTHCKNYRIRNKEAINVS